ncbi:hypothetical protein MATL_G00229840 [Megalops atlanticus]|uniref:C-type lectin domain-containing protein n=1 Tax=Megalops atlanticus TaxID=7932 RepID=A0A9D3PDF3_MEGAT|nr:hypothetical protein MATL_G00229840 [Megalops atlanticus]
MSDEVCYSTVVFANPGTAYEAKKEEETIYARVRSTATVQTVHPTGPTEKKEEEIPYADMRSEQTAPPPGTQCASIEKSRLSVPSSCRVAAVCLGLLSVLLLTAIIVLCVYSYPRLRSDIKNLTLTNHMLQADIDNLTIALGHLSKEKTEAEAERDILNQTYTMLLQYFPVESYCPVKNGTQERTCHPCLPGWIEFNSTQKCYYFSTERKNWIDSRIACKRLDADLVIIKNAEEQAFISQKIEQYGSLQWEGYWIGVTDAVTEGTWVWVDSTPMTTSFWDYTEPNDIHNEDCATTIKRKGPLRSWHDISCSNSYRWICETKALKGSN